MALKEKTRDDVVVLHPYGFLTGGNETDDLERRLNDLSAAGTRTVVLNLHDTQHLTSVGIGTIAAAYLHYKNAGGELRVCSIYPKMNSLVVALLVRIFGQVYETEDQAVMGF